MNASLAAALVLSVIPATGAIAATPTQQYSHGDPSNLEQYSLELLNRARANPTA